MNTPDLYLQGDSKNYRNWQSLYEDMKTCKPCKDNHGKIYDISAKRYQPEHPYCRCLILPMRTKEVGTATEKGFDGADAWLMYRSRLPDYYLTKEEAIKLGWVQREGNLADIAPGKQLGGNIFLNDLGKLPDMKNRIWYEADINYTVGFRNTQRILYSNDGLVFVSYDHYQTFYEITR